ncbi:MAG: carboxypeptidase-like regulatory domain-containing protein [Vicinamibacterales bacterium]
MAQRALSGLVLSSLLLVTVGTAAGQPRLAVASAQLPQADSRPGLAPGAPPGTPTGGDAPARDEGQRRTGAGRIRGRVVAADTGQPLRRAVVRASAPENRETVSARTGADGFYELKSLPAGRYTISVSKPAFVSLAYGQTRVAGSGRPIEVKGNQTIERIDLRLTRGGIITGTIVDEFGDPMPDTQVTALRQQYVAGRRRLMPGRMTTTNDVGAFRLFGLTAGTYYLAASPESVMQMVEERSDGQTDYAPTYYPGTADIAAAEWVTVSGGQTVSGLTISLMPTQLARISGMVLDEFGGRARVGGVTAVPRGDLGAGRHPAIGLVGPDGTFTIAGVAPGEYTLVASLPPDATGSGATGIATVSVSGQDLTGVELRPAAPGSIRGRVTLDAGAVSSLQGLPLEISFLPLDPEVGVGSGMSGPPVVTLRDDLTFETRAPVGRLTAHLVSPDGRWSLASVHYQGVDVTDGGFEVSPGKDLSGIEVELTSRKQEIAGVVTTAAGKPATSYTAIVFPQNRELWQGVSRNIAAGRADQEGRFRVRTLPPGDYYVVAVQHLEDGAWADPEFLDGVWQGAAQISVREGESKTVELRLVEPR